MEALAKTGDARVPEFDSIESIRLWLSEQFLGETDPAQIVQVATAAVGRFLGARAAAYGEIDAAIEGIQISGAWSPGGRTGPLPRVPLLPQSRLTAAYRAGRTVVIEDIEAAALLPAEIDLMRSGQVGAFVAAPVLHEGRPVALFAAVNAAPRQWSRDEVLLLEHTATRIWGAIEHLRLTEQLRESEEQFRLLAEHLPGLCWIWDGQTVRWANSRWHALFDGTAGGQGDPSEIVHPDDMPLAAAAWKAMRQGEEYAEIHLRMRGKDGIYRPYLSKAAAIRDANGSVVRWCGVQIDLTERHLQDQRQALLRAFHDRTRGLPDPEAVLATVAEMLTAHFGASQILWCEAREGHEDAPEIFHAVCGVPGDAEAVADVVAPAFRHLSQPDDCPGHRPATGIHVDNLPADHPLAVAARRLGVVSSIAAPITKEGRLVAVLTILQDTPRQWTPDEIALCEEIAERLWATVSRTRAEAELRERERNQALLIAWSDRTRSETDPEAIIEDTLRCLGQEMGVSRVTYSESDAEGRIFTVRAEWRVDSVVSNLGNVVTLGTYGESVDREWISGALVVYDDVRRDPQVTPAALERYRSTQIAAFMSVPLLREGVARSIISVQDCNTRRWRDGEKQLVRDIAERAWVTIERARAQAALQERERNQQFLIAWSDRLRVETSPERIIALTLDSLAAQLGVTRVTFSEADGTHFRIEGESRADRVTSLLGRDFAVEAIGREVTQEWMHGALVRYDDVASDPRLQPETRERYRESDIAAFVTIPLVRDGRTRSALSVQHDQPRRWRDSEIQLMRDVAERTWATLERARSEERLAESEAQLAAFLENAPLVMHIQDAQGRYVRVNPEFARAIGRPMAEITGAHPRDLFPAPIAEALMAIEAQARTGAVASTELDLDLGEQYASALAILFPIQGASSSSRTAGFTIDLTERKRAEAALARSREALYQSEKLSALGSLLAGVSHELNNPLSIVVAQAVMMERQARGTELAERAQKICKAADRCARIVQTFLAMARQKRPERAAVDLNEVARAAHELTDYSLRADNIATCWELTEALPPIAADSDQLHQVLVNLIVNAQHAMAEVPPGARTLTIRTARGPSRDTVILEVADSGPGIPEEARRRIFEPFFTTKPQGHGTGMGLSFSQGLVEAHGGRLELAPSERGACFRLTLPIDEHVVVPASAPEPIAAEPSQRRALVVDDEQEIAESLADFLSLEGFICDIAVGGAAAKQRLAGGSYDLVISDLRMPEIDGPQLHAWIAAERPELLDRVGFATGDTLGASAAQFLSDVRRPVLEKPFVPDAVHRFLQEMDLA